MSRRPPSEPFSTIAGIWGFLARGGLHPADLGAPLALAVGAACFEGLSVSLLVPLTQGVMTMDFSSAQNYTAMKTALWLLPWPLPPYPKAPFILLLILILLTSLTKNALQAMSSMSFSFLVRQFSNNLRKLIFSRYMAFGKMYFDRTNAGHLQAVLLNFTNTIAFRLQELQLIFAWVFMLGVYLFLMLSISWKLTLGFILIFPLLSGSMNWLIEKIRTSSRLHSDAQSELSKRTFNILSCLQVVKSYSMEGPETGRFARQSDSVRDFEYSIDRKQVVVGPIQETIVLTLLLLLIAAMTLITVKRGPSRISGLIVYFYLIKRSTFAFGVLNNMKASFATIVGPINAVLDILDDDEKFFVPDGSEEFHALQERIEFRRLSYSYIRDGSTLRDVSFTIQKGKMTAIVGPTGAGKSTLINLLMRFYDPPPGSIRFDGTDIRRFTLESLRSALALVSQETMLFNATIRENVAYGLSPEPSEEKVLGAIRKARLEDYVSRLPKKLETLVGDRGVQLSGGEKQRVAIARAMLKDAEILILDEATSAMDSGTEKLIQEAVDEMITGKTAIVIAHRLSTIKKADKIVAIEDGRVVEEGTLEALLEKRGRFYRYWEDQRFN